MNNIRMLVVEPIKRNGVELKKDRLVRIDPASIDAFKKLYGDKVKMWMNWPKEPAIFREDLKEGPKMPVGWKSFKVSELKELANNLNLSDEGLKDELIDRIAAFETAQSN